MCECSWGHWWPLCKSQPLAARSLPESCAVSSSTKRQAAGMALSNVRNLSYDEVWNPEKRNNGSTWLVFWILLIFFYCGRQDIEQMTWQEGNRMFKRGFIDFVQIFTLKSSIPVKCQDDSPINLRSCSRSQVKVLECFRRCKSYWLMDKELRSKTPCVWVGTSSFTYCFRVVTWQW